MRGVSSRRSTLPPRQWTPGPRLVERSVDVFTSTSASADQLKLNLLSQITRLERDIALLRSRLQQMEAVSAPLQDVPAPRQRNTTPRAALAPLLLSLLPDHGELRSIDEIITGVLEAEHLATDDRPARSKAYRRANLCLHKLRTEGLVISHRVGNGRLDWGLRTGDTTTSASRPADQPCA